MTGRDRLAMAAALLLGAAVAFPAGIMFAGNPQDQRETPEAAGAGTAMREIYSPRVLSDPWFLERQRENVEALERYCRQTGNMCPEARQAQQAMER